jgi:hypothetical protein
MTRRSVLQTAPRRSVQRRRDEIREKPQLSAAFGWFAAAFGLIETGAGEGIRTLDPNLGKVVLYH